MLMYVKHALDVLAAPPCSLGTTGATSVVRELVDSVMVITLLVRQGGLGKRVPRVVQIHSYRYSLHEVTYMN